MNRTRRIAFAFMLMLLAMPLRIHAQTPAPSGQGVKSSGPRSLMAFRVTGRRGRLYEKWLMLEDTASGQFRCVNYGSGYYPTKNVDPVEDRDDMWSILNVMRNRARFPATRSVSRPTADSIDGAVALQRTEWQDLQKRAAQAMKATTVPPKKAEPSGTGDSPKPAIELLRDGGPSDEEVRRMMAEVWDYAGGKRLEWKQGGRTPSGRKYEILTFDGSEKVVASQTSVEIPNQSK
jgi:hypothetical protein